MMHSPTVLDQQTIDLLRTYDPVVARYRAFFALFDWDAAFPEVAVPTGPGKPPHPEMAYVKTFLVKICEHHQYVTQLRRFLVEHPLLVLELGFRPFADPTCLYGFNQEKTVPCDRWLRDKQHTDEQYTRTPFYGKRKLVVFLQEQGYAVDRKRVRRLMQLMGLETIYPKPRLSLPGEQSIRYQFSHTAEFSLKIGPFLSRQTVPL